MSERNYLSNQERAELWEAIENVVLGGMPHYAMEPNEAEAVLEIVNRIINVRQAETLDRIVGIADDWEDEGTPMQRNPYDSRELAEGDTLVRCAEELREWVYGLEFPSDS